VTYLNAVAERMTGWGRKEALGRPLDLVFHIVDGATRKTARNPMEGAVDRYRAIPPFRETKRYVKAITALIAHADAGSD
jgi:PAS domain-containing protein